MLILPISEEIKIKAEQYVDQYMPFDKVTKYVGSTHARWNTESNIIGLIGDLTLNNYMNVPIDTFLKLKAKYKTDNGIDIVIKDKNYDIKTTCVKDFYAVTKKHLFENKLTFGYIFNYLLTDYSELHVMGYITSYEIKEKATFHAKGSYKRPGFYYKEDDYEIHPKYLHNIEELLDKDKKGLQNFY